MELLNSPLTPNHNSWTPSPFDEHPFVAFRVLLRQHIPRDRSPQAQGQMEI